MVDRLSPLRAAFLWAVVYGVGGVVAGMALNHEKDHSSDVSFIAVVAASTAGVRTYNERQDSLKP